MRLDQAFLGLAKRHLNTHPCRLRLRYFSDEHNSFEGWLNWELFYAFACRHAWQTVTIQRECRYPGKRGLADLVIFEGGDATRWRDWLRIETKLIWDNANSGKQIKSALNDFMRIEKHSRAGLMIVAVVSAANKLKGSSLKVRAPEALIGALESKLPVSARLGRRLLFAEDNPAGPAFYLAPRIRIVAYPAGRELASKARVS